MKCFVWTTSGAAALLLSVSANAYDQCGALQNAYGPFDYWTQKKELQVVESFHFTPEVETLRSGKSGSIGADLDYTLRASPNHVRALAAMMNLAIKQKTQRPTGAGYPVECYFDRAMRFRPNDAAVRLVFANYLSRMGKNADAIKQLEIAESAGGNSGNFYYNLGLAYFEVNDYEKSVIAANRAYHMGFNLPGLKGKLVKAGKWRDLPPEAPVSPNVAPMDGGDAAVAKPADGGSVKAAQ